MKTAMWSTVMVLGLAACDAACPKGSTLDDEGVCLEDCAEDEVRDASGACVEVGDDSDVGPSDTDAPQDSDTPDDTDGAGDTEEDDTDTREDTDVEDTDLPIDTDTDPPAGPSLVGKSYVVDVTSINWGPLSALSGTVLGLFSTTPVVGVVDVTPTALDLRLGAWDDAANAQVTDIETYDLTGADFTASPSFSFDQSVLSTPVAGVQLDLANVHMEGTFVMNNQRIQDGVLSGSVDTRAIDTLVGTQGFVCLLLSFSNPCVPCPNGAGNFCLDIELTDIVADEVPGVSVVAVATTAPGASCATGTRGALGWAVVGLAGLALRRRRG